MEMEPSVVHHNPITFIGFRTIIKQNEGFEKCPKFWDEIYANHLSRVYKTGKPQKKEDFAILKNRIGQYAVCRTLDDQDFFEYMICGEYQDGPVPDGMKLLTIPESNWLEFRTRGRIPDTLQKLVAYINSQWMPAHPEYTCRHTEIEWYSDGDISSAEYEFGVFIPIEQ